MPRSLTPAELKAALPDVMTRQRFATLRSGAVIRRDKWGIPHVKAADEYDLFFAQGFATAQDRLFQMDLDRLRSLGRAAEHLGARALAQDRYMRRRQIERIAKLDYALASPAAKNAIDAYASGVNAFIDTTNSLPIEYRLLDTRPQRWEPWHCVAVYKVRNTAEGTFQGKLWLARLAAEVGAAKAAKLSPGCQPGSLLTLPPGERYTGSVLDAFEELQRVVQLSSMLVHTDGGSNAWAVCGDRTASGRPLIAGDSHRGLEVPNVYYQTHLLGGDFAVTGYSIPGFPLVLHFCHNEHVAWGMTYGGVDTQDLFVERFRESNGQLEYLRGDKWVQAHRTVETIRVRGGVMEEVEIVETRHGPVIAGNPRRGAAVAIADPGSADGTHWIHAAYAAMKARSADELEAALEQWTDRVNNYVYADVDGNFGYALRGRIPIRTAENGWGPVAGWTGKHDWAGYIPAAQLPRVRNPRAGWIVSCNQKLVDEKYPYYLSNFCSTAYRAERIATRIAELASRKITVADMVAIHGDVTSIPAQVIQQSVLRGARFAGKAAVAAHALLEWDCALTTGSAAAALYEMTAARLMELLVKAHYAALADDYLDGLDAGAEEHWRRQLKPAVIAAIERGDLSLAPAGETWESLLSSSIEWAVSQLEGRLGAEPAKWRWGGLHRSVPQHILAPDFPQAAPLLNPPRVEIAGDGDTPLVSAWRTGASFDASVGSVNRYVHDPSNWTNSSWIVPLGTSGHPGSAHYADQQPLWARLATIPQLWDWEQIGREAETEQVLERA